MLGPVFGGFRVLRRRLRAGNDESDCGTLNTRTIFRLFSFGNCKVNRVCHFGTVPFRYLSWFRAMVHDSNSNNADLGKGLPRDHDSWFQGSPLFLTWQAACGDCRLWPGLRDVSFPELPPNDRWSPVSNQVVLHQEGTSRCVFSVSLRFLICLELVKVERNGVG